MRKQKIIIFGTSKVAQVVYSNIVDDDECDFEVAGFCVDEAYCDKEDLFGLPIYSFENIKQDIPPEQYKMLVAIGYHKMNTVRRDKCEEAMRKGYNLVSYIHSKANVSKTAFIGENCIILNHASVEPFAVIGNNVCMYCNSVVAHHSKIMDHVWITSGTVIGGNSQVGEYSFLGVNSTIGHNMNIGKNNFIGAGAVVTKSTEDDSVYVLPDTPKYRLDTHQFMKLFKFD